MAEKQLTPPGVDAPNGAIQETINAPNHIIPEATRQPDNATDGQATAEAPQPNITAVTRSPNDVLAVIGEHFVTSVVLSAEACIAATCSLLLAEADGCVALVLEGPASSGKTTALNLLTGKPTRSGGLVVVSDSFTPAAFLSHAANRTAVELESNDLLPRIRHKTLVVPDLAPTFSAREEDLAKNVGVLTRMLDGQGYESDSGTHGHRGYVGDYRFTLLAATTPLSPSAWRVMGGAGNRILMLEVGGEAVTTDDLVASMMGSIPFERKVKECGETVGSFLLMLWQQTGGYGRVTWNASADDPDLLRVLVRVAEWVVRCRGNVTAEQNGFDEGSHAPPQVEAPHRLINGLYKLTKGHAIACGRRKLAPEDVQLAVRVGLDSMPFERRRVVRALLKSASGELTSADVELVLGHSRPTARKVMDALGALGAVRVKMSGTSLTISLLDSERWLLEANRRWALARLP